MDKKFRVYLSRVINARAWEIRVLMVALAFRGLNLPLQDDYVSLYIYKIKSRRSSEMKGNTLYIDVGNLIFRFLSQIMIFVTNYDFCHN